MIAICDIDSKMANIPLMKISSYYKGKVNWFIPGMYDVDKLYVSKIFKFSQDIQFKISGDIICGGTGYNPKNKLHGDIEIQQPDYNIYPNSEYSVQFYSRGCIRKCPFCVVPQKEGKIKHVTPMNLNPKGKHIEVFDNNFFSNPNWKFACLDLLKIGQPVNLHGIDARILTEEHAYYLNKLNHAKWDTKKSKYKKQQIRMAWDNPEIDMRKTFEKITKWIKPYKIMVYVLIGYWSTHEQNLDRVLYLDSIGVDPFVMPYNKEDDYQNAFTRWVNHRATFKSVKWEKYTG